VLAGHALSIDETGDEEISDMHNPMGARQLDAFTCRAMFRLPDHTVIEAPREPVPATRPAAATSADLDIDVEPPTAGA
jgi:hypothetical protein